MSPAPDGEGMVASAWLFSTPPEIWI